MGSQHLKTLNIKHQQLNNKGQIFGLNRRLPAAPSKQGTALSLTDKSHVTNGHLKASLVLILFNQSLQSFAYYILMDRRALICMCLLSLQFGLQPTLTRAFTPNGVCRSTVVLMQEVLKFCFAYIMLRASGTKQSAVAGTCL